jgi:hypothetical protein
MRRLSSPRARATSSSSCASDTLQRGIRIRIHSNNVVEPVTQCYSSGSVGSVCFWPSGSGYPSQRSGSGSFFYQAKIVRKNLIPTVLRIIYYTLLSRQRRRLSKLSSVGYTKCSVFGIVTVRAGHFDGEMEDDIRNRRCEILCSWKKFERDCKRNVHISLLLLY